ncbi:hypothetical protein KEM54_006465 [Ascosphaera aggregata]|nr:hypothetical protein KEM54_006465 [Ascosphaera aggregata]
MSKQYLALHTVDNAHPSDIYSLAVTDTHILSVSGASSLHIHSSTQPDLPLLQSFPGVHKIGCHHVATASNVKSAVTVGFDGLVRIWTCNGDVWSEAHFANDNIRDIWAPALSSNGQYLAGTTTDGRVKVWDLFNAATQISEFETKGSFGMCISLSNDGLCTATGHQSGMVYLLDNSTGRIVHSLSGLVEPVRCVAFSPAGKYLAAAGDSRVIVLFERSSGEVAASFTGHNSWITSLDWSATGEYLLSSSLDGKVKVWSIERNTCVATHSESDKTIWSVKWLPRVTKTDRFVTAGADRAITLYREATGA